MGVVSNRWNERRARNRGLAIEAGSFSHDRVRDGAVLGAALDDVVDLVLGVADPRGHAEAGRDVVCGAAALPASDEDACVDERLEQGVRFDAVESEERSDLTVGDRAPACDLDHAGDVDCGERSGGRGADAGEIRCRHRSIVASHNSDGATDVMA